MLSLSATGMPASGPSGSPRRAASSTSPASDSARSPTTHRNAFSSSSSCAIRTSAAWTSATGESSPLSMRARAWAIESSPTPTAPPNAKFPSLAIPGGQHVRIFRVPQEESVTTREDAREWRKFPVGGGGGATGHLVQAERRVPSLGGRASRSEEHTSELQSRQYLVCRLLLEKKKHNKKQ